MVGTKLVRLPTRTLLSQAETRASDAPVSWSHGSSFKAPTSQRKLGAKQSLPVVQAAAAARPPVFTPAKASLLRSGRRCHQRSVQRQDASQGKTRACHVCLRRCVTAGAAWTLEQPLHRESYACVQGMCDAASSITQAGIVFDEIWAWELAGYDPQCAPQCCPEPEWFSCAPAGTLCATCCAGPEQEDCMRREYWSVVPDDYVSRLHFYNTGFDINTSHAAHPMNIIRAIYRPGDVVIIKLDIDNSPLELSVIKEIEENPNLAKMVTEMFFEMHYDHPHMAEFGFDNGRTLWDVVARFKALRRAGLILHYWP